MAEHSPRDSPKSFQSFLAILAPVPILLKRNDIESFNFSKGPLSVSWSASNSFNKSFLAFAVNFPSKTNFSTSFVTAAIKSFVLSTVNRPIINQINSHSCGNFNILSRKASILAVSSFRTTVIAFRILVISPSADARSWAACNSIISRFALSWIAFKSSANFW